MEDKKNLNALWQKVTDQVKQRVIHTTLWRTLELAVPITVENNEFVVGFAPGDFNLSGYLTSSEHQNAINSALRQFTGHALTVRVIEGTTLQDWAQVKAKDESVQSLKAEAYRKRDAENTVTRSWDGLLETVGRKYANSQMRQLPQSRARYIVEMLKLISDEMDDLMPPGAPKDELAERSLARVIDRVGTLAEVPSALIALELMRFRGK